MKKLRISENDLIDSVIHTSYRVSRIKLIVEAIINYDEGLIKFFSDDKMKEINKKAEKEVKYEFGKEFFEE